MRACLVALLLTLAVPSLSQTQPTLRTVRVKIEASELDKAMLLNKLNEHGADHGLKFELTDKGYEYRLVFDTFQHRNIGATLAGAMAVHYSGAEAQVYDTQGRLLFGFKRGTRYTDKGATNAAAKEIIKRLIRWWKTPEGKKEAPTQ